MVLVYLLKDNKGMSMCTNSSQISSNRYFNEVYTTKEEEEEIQKYELSLLLKNNNNERERLLIETKRLTTETDYLENRIMWLKNLDEDSTDAAIRAMCTPTEDNGGMSQRYTQVEATKALLAENQFQLMNLKERIEKLKH